MHKNTLLNPEKLLNANVRIMLKAVSLLLMIQRLVFEGTELYGPDNISPFLKCRTVGRHAGDHHGSPFSSRVLREDISKNIYRHITMTVNSIFTQSLQIINSLYSAKLKFKHI